MRIVVSLLLLTTILLLTTASSAGVSQLPVGGCPDDFELHEAMDHDMPDHRHAGLKVDLNGDGFICVRHATETNHVHIDNFAVVP